MVYLADVEEDDVEDAEDGSGQPDGDEGDEREGDAPDERQRQGQESRQQTVDPVTRSGEEDESRAPDRVESVRCVRFGQHILKVQLSNTDKTHSISFQHHVCFCLYCIIIICNYNQYDRVVHLQPQLENQNEWHRDNRRSDGSADAFHYHFPCLNDRKRSAELWEKILQKCLANKEK